MKSAGYPTLKERNRIYKKVVSLLETGLTIDEFEQFHLALDSDLSADFLTEYLSRRLAKLRPDLFNDVK